MWNRDVAQVRRGFSGFEGRHVGPVVRLKCRADLYLDHQTIDWSFISWQHPVQELVRNEVTEQVGFLLADVIQADIAALIATTFDDALRDFPRPGLL